MYRAFYRVFKSPYPIAHAIHSATGMSTATKHGFIT